MVEVNSFVSNKINNFFDQILFLLLSMKRYHLLTTNVQLSSVRSNKEDFIRRIVSEDYFSVSQFEIGF